MFIVFLLLAYFVGSVSFSILLSRWAKAQDPRKHGSGNPGATNVYRGGRKLLALAVFFADMFKPLIPMLFAWYGGLGDVQVAWIGVAAVIGHIFPMYYNFKGGKGVATTLGALIFIHWPLALTAFLTWVLIMLLSRIVSLASVIAAVSIPLVVAYLGLHDLFWVSSMLAVLVIWSHRANIQRLVNGEEKSIKSHSKT